MTEESKSKSSTEATKLNSAAIEDCVFSQLPTAQWGGYYSSAEAHQPTGGVTAVMRAADDFTVERAISVSVVTWWGGSSDGYHHEIDTIDQVSAFLVEIFDTDATTQSIGLTLHRESFSLADSHPIRTDLKMFAGSDVFRHAVHLRKPFVVYPGHRYWLSVSAYLNGAPMWVWFKSDERSRNAVVDLGVDGIWNDEPKDHSWTEKLALAFELRGVPAQVRSQ